MKFDKRLLAEARTVRGYLVLTIGLGGLGGLFIVAQARALSSVIDRVFLKSATLADVTPALIALLIIIVVRAVLAWGGEVSAIQVAARVKTALRQRVFDKLMHLGPAYIRGERTGELTNTAIDGIEALEAYFSQYLPQVVLAALVPLIILAFVFPIDLLSGIVLLLTAPFIPLLMMLIGQAAEVLTRHQYKALSFMSAHLLDVLQGLTTLKILGRSRRQIETIGQVSERFRDTTMSVLRVAFLSAFALEMIATISTAIIAVEIGLRLLAGNLLFEQALFILILAPDFYAPLRLLGTRFHAGMSGVAAAARIFEILEEPENRDRGSGIGDQAGALSDQWQVIRFETVKFAYGDDRAAVNDVTFEIKRGERAALVGATGAGKSTLANLLLRFIEPHSGAIKLDTTPLSSLSIGAWRDQVAWVPQLPYLFHATVFANIALARPDASLDEVIHVAQLARADDFIRALPQGYDTLIGERGARLSGGQAQRIALARAFLKDAPLLILDEAAANLDLETEDLIQSSIDQLLQDCTALIITHRLSTAARADRIVVLDHGVVIEQGTPAELMTARGAYYRLVVAQGVTVDERRMTVDERRTTDAALPGRHQSSTVRRRSSSRSIPVGLVTRHSSLITFRRLLQLAAPFKGWMALSVLLGAITIGSSIGLLATSAWIIATAALQPSVADLAVAIVGVRFFGIARGVLRYLERLVSHHVNFSLLAKLRVWFYAAIEPLAPARLMTYRSGDLLSRIVGDIETLQNFFIRVIAPLLVALVIALAAMIFFAAFDVSLAIVIVTFMILIGVIVPLGVQRLSRATSRRLVAVRSELNVTLIDGLQGAADLIAFGRERDQAKLVSALSVELAQLQGRMASITGLHTALGVALTNLALWSVLLIAIPLVREARLTGIDLAVLPLAALACFEGALALPLAFQYLETNLEAARRLFEIVDAEESTAKTRRREEETVDSFASSRLRGRVAELNIRDVSFRYNADEPLALNKVSLSVKTGQRVAIVGASGAGKSTLINLLLRFWDYAAGSIMLNGLELRDADPDDVRRQFGVVSQTTHLFNATIRENLLLARADATEAEMITAAQQAQIHDFIQALPLGYDTPVGEQGLRLSGGERQRLAIARAMLKDAPIVIFDEATANLDSVTERKVWQALRALMADRAVLIVTHRLIGLEEADEIIVLQQGCIVERGRHAALIDRAGVYYRLWLRQQQHAVLNA
ncbi:MAG: thiol reductant ABC exporter subunit CydD [Chloroflexi bacterium]|nr:thiol reductant ABC exporter subunit CydD [Chloroflexota bacterium]